MLPLKGNGAGSLDRKAYMNQDSPENYHVHSSAFCGANINVSQLNRTFLRRQPPVGKSTELRFGSKVNEAGPIMLGMPSCCHEWTGTMDMAGYPKFWLDGNSMTAQRAFQIIQGIKLTPRQRVINICGNRGCVRDDHLAIGRLSDAHALRWRGPHQVWPGDMAFMRSLVNSGEVTVKDLTEAYDLSFSVLDRIVAVSDLPN